MEISKEYIEELIFDYHEGNLSEHEKAEVLNLIHQYPEYESNFILMAQTYAHVDNELPDYGLTASLLKEPVSAWYTQYWFKGVVLGAVIVGIGLYLYFPINNSKNVEIPIHVNEGTKSVPFTTENGFTLQEKKAVENIPLQKIEKLPDVTFKAKDTADVTIDKSSEHTVYILNKQESITELPPVTSTVVQVSETVDSVHTQQTKTLQKEEVSKSKKKKYNNNLNLKPASKFIPVNSDF